LRSLPPDIDFLVSSEGAYIEIESFIRFLRSEENVPDEYKSETIHLQKIAAYLESELAEVLAQKRLLSEDFDTEKPN
jgi:hypothetical protein